MKAIVYEKYGPPEVLKLKEIPTPTAKDNELLIEVRATTVTSGDARMRALNVPRGFGLLSRLALGIFAPRRQILGMELSGVVVAVGKNVTRFQVGNPVFGMSDAYGGCYVEYRALPETEAIAKKPENLTFEEAASLCFGGTTALDFFRRGKLRSGERLLVNGASGAVGTAAVQLAKHLGAHVTGVCSTANLDLVRSLGADAVIDYTKEDFTRNGEVYDAIMDTAGTAPFSRCQVSLKPGGRFLLVLGGLSDTLGSSWVNMTTDKKVVAGVAKVRPEDVRLLGELAEAGKYKPVIDRTYPLEQIVEAHAYVDEGHKKGNVVITVGHGALV
ncbi:NAD(P)-dependent alcohol dehydrogenase [Oligoflexus tunisiensis]|uniref:NAD(P)-dependent alcohol dehydrogenase n=1 Tax=Oligoflexus tunisiensis TaxID=708132 RepID=UPI000A8D6AF1|nr:NAD(P)-dependent alcohol dehydrogenase [Oligoflexus tunisiensis]